MPRIWKYSKCGTGCHSSVPEEEKGERPGSHCSGTQNYTHAKISLYRCMSSNLRGLFGWGVKNGREKSSRNIRVLLDQAKGLFSPVLHYHGGQSDAYGKSARRSWAQQRSPLLWLSATAIQSCTGWNSSTSFSAYQMEQPLPSMCLWHSRVALR